ncbi:hypothetical protein CVT25_007114 [Psilocybe cyanescens]|uniref:Histone deacetylase interacting domain-containing protein n=1 Tax=Psilocybe cyanescens TaxID=93625 RepID=A0A409WVQ3_PSICY|nr:hypothetical protein CVT25_007114 [Psilocybe cyanescens]
MATTQGLDEITQANINNAMSYIDFAKAEFQDKPEVYDQFIQLMTDFHLHKVDVHEVSRRVTELFAGHPSLTEGFKIFLPSSQA